MANEVVIHVRVENDTRAGLNATRSDLRRAGQDMTADMRRSGDDAGRGFGDRLRSTLVSSVASTAREFTGKLKDQINSAMRGVNGARIQIEANTERATAAIGRLRSMLGDARERIRINVDVDEDSFVGRVRRMLTRTRQQSEDSGNESGRSFTERFSDQLKELKGRFENALSGFKKFAGPVGIALGVGLGLSMMQGIGAVLASGSAISVLTVGVASAIKADKGLQAVGLGIGRDFMKSLSEGAKAYTGPLLSAFGVIRDAAGRIGKTLGEAFGNTSGMLVPLVRDITAGVEGLITKISQIASDAGPTLEGFGDAFRMIMDGIGDALVSITGDGADFGDTMRYIGAVTADTIRIFGELIGAIGRVTEFVSQISFIKGYYEDAAGGAEELAGSHTVLASSFSAAERAARGELSALEALSNELRAETDPVFGIIQAQNDLAAAQKATSEATKKHGKNSKEAQAALRDQATAALDLEANIGKLGGTFDGKMTPALRATLRAAGLTDSAIDGLSGQFKSAKKTGDAFAKTYTGKVKVENAAAARAALYGVRDAANDIPRAVTIALRITGGSSVSAAAASVRKNMASGGIKGAADGSSGGGLTWVGEYGPELLTLPAGTQVKSAGSSASLVDQMMASSATRYGMGTSDFDFMKKQASGRASSQGRTGDQTSGISSDARRTAHILDIVDKAQNAAKKTKKGSSRSGSSGGSSSGSGDDISVELSWNGSGAPALIDVLMKSLRAEIRTQGGNVQQVLG